MIKKVNFTTQNRLIIFGLLLSTILIMAIAVFSVLNIQNKLNEGYHNFGQIISKTLAIESSVLTKSLPKNEIYETLKEHSDSITKANTIQATAKTNNNDALVVEDIWLIILPESPIVTAPIIGLSFNGELTVILGFFMCFLESLRQEYIKFPSLSVNSIKTISL